MNRRASLAAAVVAWAAFTVAWFLPALNADAEFALKMPGWKAFLSAVTVAWDGGKMEFEWLGVLCAAGVLSNAFVLISPWMVLRGGRIPVWFVAGLSAAFAVNLLWLTTFKLAELRPAYWMWLGSMGILAAIAISRSRAR